MVKNVLIASLSVFAFVACGIPDADMAVSDDVQAEAEVLEEGSQELTSSLVKDWFPLQAGNEWTFQGLNGTRTVKVEYANGNIAYVTGLHAEGKWVGVSASTPNTLYAWDSDAGRWNVFIRFGYAVTPWTYYQSNGGCQKFAAKRTATGAEYAMPAGAFSDTRTIGFTMQPAPNVRCAQPDFTELVFAAKVGPIVMRNGLGEKLALISAKVGATLYPKSTVTGSVVVKTTTDKATYTNYANTIRCITTPCPSNEVTADANVTITMVNSTNEVQSFRFSSGCQTKIEIIDSMGKVVRNNEISRLCTMALTTVALSPGQTKTWTESVPLAADSGEQLRGTYKIKGSVIPSSSGWTGSLSGTATVTVAVQ